ncbi:MAG: GntR family transcriptional regulator [Rhodobacterales bacterium]|nr:MAG: GntR family transcriptional regulator [Rhodobacterales bacterium]
MEHRVEKLPDHERAHRALRQMILYGDLAPGQPVTIQGLVEQMALGVTPVREAIRRLTTQGALAFKGNRRVEVPQMDAGVFAEISYARLAIEPHLARLATPRLTPEAIFALSAANDATDRAIAQGDVSGYLRQNHRFHAGLYRAAGAEVLFALSDTLWLRMGPSLRVVLGRHGTANLPDMHLEALAAMRAGDAEGVASAIRGDIEQGIAQVRTSLAAAPL